MKLRSFDSFVRQFDAGETILEQGSVGSEFYVVLSGRAVIRARTGDRETDLAFREPGEFFGEMSAIDGEPRSASVVAIESPTTVLIVDRARFVYFVSQQPAFALLLMDALSRRNRGSQPRPSPFSDPLSRRSGFTVVPVTDTVTQLRAKTRSSNAYLFRGAAKTVLIDPGLPDDFDDLAASLASCGAGVDAIDMVILTHEHFDHVGATIRFEGRPIVAAHRLAANKMRLGDDLAINPRAYMQKWKPFPIDLLLEDGAVIDTGTHRLQILHTPGHTSGCINLLDQQDGVLVTGDVVFGGGPFTGIFGSGNISDQVETLLRLSRLDCTCILPGHGPLSRNPHEDINRTLEHCYDLLKETSLLSDALDTRDGTVRIINSVRDINRSWLNAPTNLI
jgi:hydroxyacylglutathione hydrolase